MTTSPASGRVPSDTFGNRLAVMRHELGLTLEEAADRAGLKRATWRTWEHGAKPRDMARVVRQIEDAFGYDAVWLMWGGQLAPVDRPPSGGIPTQGHGQDGSTAGLSLVGSTGRDDPEPLVHRAA